MIKNLPAASRPREKLIQRGAKTLTDAELLAIVLRTGVSGKHVLDLAEELIEKFGGLQGLLQSEYEEFQNVKGLGAGKYTQLAAIKEISSRSLHSQLQTKSILDSTDIAAEFLKLTMGHYQKEVFACILLNTRNELIAFEEIFTGTINTASIYPREILKLVLKMNASAVIFAHNHPSGYAQPSCADKQITQQLKKALSLIDVQVLDHIIVGNSTFSMAANGLI